MSDLEQRLRDDELSRRVAWLRRQASREEDRQWRLEAVFRRDAELIEGLVGERAALRRRLSEQEQATRELRRWSIYVHEDDPRFLSIRRDDQPGDTLLRTSDGHVDQAQAAEFAAAVRGALSSECEHKVADRIGWHQGVPVYECRRCKCVFTIGITALSSEGARDA